MSGRRQGFFPPGTYIVIFSLELGLPRWLVLVVKNLLANTGDERDAGLIPGSERFPGG